MQQGSEGRYPTQASCQLAHTDASVPRAMAFRVQACGGMCTFTACISVSNIGSLHARLDRVSKYSCTCVWRALQTVHVTQCRDTARSP